MLSKVSTPVTVNYDIDVMLPPDNYEVARDRITKGGYDLIYPYFLGESQYQITTKSDDLFDPRYLNLAPSVAGHVQFFKTESYRNGFMENENFISYGAEDSERLNRFKVLGYKVDHCNGMFVFHIEHSRGINSSWTNPHFDANATLYYHLKNMDRDKLIEYYAKQTYLKKYTQ
jgi:predicted glycosyltransferase involved in capsule biosynthesis